MLRTTSSFVAAARCALLAAALPWLSTLACGDDATPDGSGAGAGGQGGSAGAAGGSAGSAGAAGTAGSGGSSAGSGGSSGSAGASAGSGGSSGVDAGLEPDAGGGDASTGVFTLTSTAVDDVAGCGPDVGDRDLCDLFPAENTGLNGAANVSPQFDWTGVPAGTQSFAIALHDLSNTPNSDPFTHWVMWNIPGSATGLPAELPEGLEPGVPSADTRQVSFLTGKNNGFAGSGAAGNVYEFVLFALDTATFDPGSTDPDEVEDAIASSNDVIGTATLRARSVPTN